MTETTEHTNPMTNNPAQAERKQRVLEELSANPFSPPLWLTNAHAQTVGARYGRRIAPPEFRREQWDTPDDDFLNVYFLDAKPDQPTLLILHGLEGCRESRYLQGLAHEFSGIGWNVVLFEFRSCGGEINRARRMYHSGETTDIDFVVRRLIEQRPGIRLFIAGFSLGGNVTAKWLGESGDNVPTEVEGAAVISAPYNLLESSIHMDGSLSRMYVLHFLRYLIPKAIEKEKQYPGCMDIEAVKRSRSFKAFDDTATAPLHGFNDAEDYYRKSGCGQYLSGIRRPTLLLSAADDPFNPGHTLPTEIADTSPYLHPQFPKRGGHVGFVESRFRSWSEPQISRFFQYYAELG